MTWFYVITVAWPHDAGLSWDRHTRHGHAEKMTRLAVFEHAFELAREGRSHAVVEFWSCEQDG